MKCHQRPGLGSVCIVDAPEAEQAVHGDCVCLFLLISTPTLDLYDSLPKNYIRMT